MSKIFFIGSWSADAAEALAIAKWLEDNGWSEYFLDLTHTRVSHQARSGKRRSRLLPAAAKQCSS